MSNLRDLLNKAQAKAEQKATASQTKVKSAPTYNVHNTKVESQNIQENQFDDLDGFMSDLSNTAVPPNFNSGISKDGNQLTTGDPVVGIHRGQRMNGQVIAVNGDKVTVEWKDRSVTEVPADSLELTNVDDDYAEETMYIESNEPIQNMGFDKESFVEDSDLESLLRGRADGSLGETFKYGNKINEF